MPVRDFGPIGETVRYPDFSGEQIDQALLNHVVAGIADANNADPAGTAAVGSLARLRDECRQAKERLSAETATVVPAELPGFSSDIRLTRAELESLIEEPLAGVLNAVEEPLQRNQIPVASLAAVATVGGGASIPLVTQRLSERLRAPVVTTPQSQLNVAAGAALLADRGLSTDEPTGMVSAADAPTGVAAAGWAAGAAGLAAASIGVRRRPIGDIPRAGVVAGRRAERRARALRGRGLQLRLRTGRRHRGPPAGGVRPGRRTTIRPSRNRCPGTSAHRCCSGPRPPRRCSRSAAWRTR